MSREEERRWEEEERRWEEEERRRKVDLSIWKTIRLDTGLKTVNDFYCALKDGGYHLDGKARDEWAFKVGTKNTEVNLVRLSGEELGFEGGALNSSAPLFAIYREARALGLELCPAEVGPQLRLQYKDQPKDECLLVGTEFIIDSDNKLCYFAVGRDAQGNWLGIYRCRLNDTFPIDRRWVFLK